MNSMVTLTTQALSFVKNILEKTPQAYGLRLGVKSYGCSGLGYVVDCAKEHELTDVDLVFKTEGIPLVVDKQSLPYLKGVVIDCVTEGLNQTLKVIENPNATGGCGCGESFSVDK